MGIWQFREQADNTVVPPSDAIRGFTGRWRGLSNFEPAWVYFDGKAYPTVEHAFQAAKTFDPVEREGIRSARTPGRGKTPWATRVNCSLTGRT